jgi:DNA-binding transcriptional LysR family regulator
MRPTVSSNKKACTTNSRRHLEYIFCVHLIATAYRWEFEQDSRVITFDVPGQLTLDDASLMLEAALAGTGLAYLADWWIDKSVREGKLRRVLDGFIPSSAGLCLYYPSRRYQPAGLRTLISFIQDVYRRGHARPG